MGVAQDYANQLLKSTIYKQDPTLIEVLEGNLTKEDYLFDEPQTVLFNILRDNYIKNDKVPSKEFLDNFYRFEKTNISKELWKELKSDSIEIIDDIKEMTDLALNVIVRSRAKDTLKQVENSIKLSDTSSIQDTIDALQENLSELQDVLKGDTHTEMLLFGPEVSDTYKKEYYKAKENLEFIYRGKTGISVIDNAITGYDIADLVNIAGFTNQGKSPMLRFLAYQLLLQGLNVVFFTLEISIEKIREQFYVLHANNGKRFSFNSPKITLQKVKSKEMTEQEEDYFLNKVIPDFTNAKDMGSLYILQPDGEYTFDDMCMKVRKINKNIMPVDVLVLDYATLLLPTRNVGHINKDVVNLMLRRLRQFSLTFKKFGADRSGLLIINAAQVNRGGFEDACKHPQNMYQLSALGDYNALEKDATTVLSILQTDEMRAAGEVQLQPLKLREGTWFKPFKMVFDGGTGYFYETNQQISTEDKEAVLEEIEL